jgi:hypothetical protein
MPLGIEKFQAVWELEKIIWGSGILKINSRPRDLIFKSSHGQVTKSKSRVLQINNYVYRKFSYSQLNQLNMYNKKYYILHLTLK